MSAATPLVSTTYRLHHMGLRVDGDVLDFARYWYLGEILDGRAPRTTIIKGAQLGLSVACILRCIEDQLHLGLRGSGYFFPTDREVSDFSKARFDPILAQYGLAARVNTTEIKEIGDGYVWFRAAGPRGGGQKSLSATKSFPADKLYLDEYDEMAPSRVDSIRHRLDGADPDVREEIGLSTPTIPEYGVHYDYQRSDQRVLMQRCGKCGGWTCLEDTWPDCIAEPASGAPYYVCSKCKGPLSRTEGEWVARHPDRSAYHRGFHLSQLCSPKRTAAQILLEHDDAVHRGRLREFYNQTLARPYADIDDQLQEAQLLDCLDRDRPRSPRSIGPSAIGVDVGVRDLHYVVGGRTSSDGSRIADFGVVESFDELGQLAARHNVACGVIDIGAETRKVREFLDAHAGWYGCQYATRRAADHEWDAKSRLVKADRNQVLDASHQAILGKRDRFPAPDERWHTLLVPQMLNMARMRQTDEDTGSVAHRWVVTGGVKNDHLKHAHGYYRLALSRVGLAADGNSTRRTPQSRTKRHWMAA